jgi:protein subunit release factor B
MSWGPQNFVMIEHLPSGMVTKADYTRSNVRCKHSCWSMLRGKLWSLERAAEAEPTTDAQREIAERVLSRNRGTGVEPA